MDERTNVCLSDEVRELLEAHSETGVSVGALVKAIGERGFGLLLIVASLPLLVPMPPGTSGLLGMVILVVSLQALVGRDSIWLPRRCMAWRLSPRAIRFLIGRALPLLRRVETWGDSRSCRAVSARRLRWVCAASAVMGLILATPIPFFNTIPALVTLALGVGLMKENPRLLNVAVAVTGVLFLAIVGGLTMLIAHFDSLHGIEEFFRLHGFDGLFLGGCLSLYACRPRSESSSAK